MEQNKCREEVGGAAKYSMATCGSVVLARIFHRLTVQEPPSLA